MEQNSEIKRQKKIPKTQAQLDVISHMFLDIGPKTPSNPHDPQSYSFARNYSIAGSKIAQSVTKIKRRVMIPAKLLSHKTSRLTPIVPDALRHIRSVTDHGFRGLLAF
jgi:hypothetical protein